MLERITGPRLSDAMTAGEVSADEGARLLAGLHDRLHALPWDRGALLHLDLHPENVLLGPAGPVVIDWTNARTGPAGLDVAMSGLILSQVAEAVAAYGELIDGFVRSFVRLIAHDPAAYVDEAVALRRGDPHLTPTERDQLSTAGDRLRAAC